MHSNHFMKDVNSSNPEKRSIAVNRMFGSIASSYDSLNTIMTAGRHHTWRRIAVKNLTLKKGAKVLDLCTGSGDFITPLLNRVGDNGKVVAVDYCEELLHICKTKHGTKKNVEIVQADALNLPFEDNTFDAITVGWGLRNLVDLDKGLTEISRVLKTGGTFVSIDTARPDNQIMYSLSKFVLGNLLPLVWRFSGNSSAGKYLFSSTQNFISLSELSDKMYKSGIKTATIEKYMFGNIGIIWGKKG